MKKQPLYILIGLIILILLSIFVVKPLLSSITVPSKVKENDPAVESSVIVAQKEVSAMAFTTNESDTEYRIHTVFLPFLNFTIVDREVKSFKIENFVGNSNRGEVLLIAPTDLDTSSMGSSFIFTNIEDTVLNSDIKGSGNSISFEIVDTVTKYNEVTRKDYIMPQFRIIVKDMGSINYEEISERDSLYDGSKIMQYLGIDENTISFQFDVKIQFVDGEEYVKRFSGSLSEGELFDTASTQFSLEVVE